MYCFSCLCKLGKRKRDILPDDICQKCYFQFSKEAHSIVRQYDVFLMEEEGRSISDVKLKNPKICV